MHVGLGDTVHAVLSKVGITPERVAALFGKEDCGCGERQQWLNNVVPYQQPIPDAPSPEWYAAMTVAPRKKPTWQDSLTSCEMAGWEPHLFVEPGMTIPSDVVPEERQHYNESVKGCWYNFLHSLKWGLENTEAEVFLTIQDDAFFHMDSKDWVESVLWPNPKTGFLSLYTSRAHKGDGVFRPATNHSFWGNLAVVWPRQVVEEFVVHPKAQNWMGVGLSGRSRFSRSCDSMCTCSEKCKQVTRQKVRRRDNPSVVKHSDVAIGLITQEMGYQWWSVNPSPVRHIADSSTLNHGGNTENRNCEPCADLSEDLFELVRPHTTFEWGGRCTGPGEADYLEAVAKWSQAGYSKGLLTGPATWLTIKSFLEQGAKSVLVMGESVVPALAPDRITQVTDWDSSPVPKSHFYAPVITSTQWYARWPKKRHDVVLVSDSGRKQNNLDRRRFMECVRDVCHANTTVIITDATKDGLVDMFLAQWREKGGKTPWGYEEFDGTSVVVFEGGSNGTAM